MTRWYKMFDRWKLGLYPWILMIWAKLKVLVRDAPVSLDHPRVSHMPLPLSLAPYVYIEYSFCNPANRFECTQESEKLIHQEMCLSSRDTAHELSVRHMFQLPDVWLKAPKTKNVSLLGAYAAPSYCTPAGFIYTYLQYFSVHDESLQSITAAYWNCDLV